MLYLVYTVGNNIFLKNVFNAIPGIPGIPCPGRLQLSHNWHSSSIEARLLSKSPMIKG